MLLTSDDLPLVFEKLHHVRKKWYEIGLQLPGPSVDDLETISLENKNDQNICLRKVLMLWLKSGKATWSAMCSALENCTIGERVLAEELRREYLKHPSAQPSEGRLLVRT